MSAPIAGTRVLGAPIRAAILLALVLAAGARPLRAQNADETAILFLKIPTVQGASRFDQTASEAPASVTVITAEEISRHGWRTLGDIVNTVRGFFTTFDRAYTYVGARGFGRPGDYSSRLLLMVDGRAVNEPIYGSSAYGTESLVDVGDIQRVEFIRGPGSSLYGTNAFFGVINVITHRGRELSGGRARVLGGSFGTGLAEARFGRRFDSGLEIYASGQLYQQEGQELFYEEFGGVAHYDRDRRQHFTLRLSSGDLSVEAMYNIREKQVPTGSYGNVFDDPRATVRDGESFVSAAWDRTWSDGRRIAASVGYYDYHYRGGFPQDDGLYLDRSSAGWVGADASVLRPIGRRHKLIVGGEYRVGLAQEQASWKEGEPAAMLGDDARDGSWALFAQDEMRVGRLLVNLGARLDFLETYGSTVNPRAAAVYGWNRGAAKLLYGQAFRGPSLFELYYEDGYSVKASPGLTPEKIITVEGVLEQQVGQHVRGVLSVYRYRATDLISQVKDPADDLLTYRNADAVVGEGIEGELEFEFPFAQGRASYALQRARDVETDAGLTNSPTHLLQLAVSRALIEDRLTAGFTLVGMSRRDAPGGAQTGRFAVGNLTVRGRRIAGRVGGSLAIYNLWNTRYDDPAGEEHERATLRQDGRQVRMALSVEF